MVELCPFKVGPKMVHFGHNFGDMDFNFICPSFPLIFRLWCALSSKFLRLHPVLVDFKELITRIYFLKCLYIKNVHIRLIAIV